MSWAADMLGFQASEQQKRASLRLAQERKLSIRSGHGTGKTTFMALTSLWFMSCFFPCKIPCTAPTGHQLSDVLWAEIAKWIRVLEERHPAMRGTFEWTSTHISLTAAPQESFAVARTARPEKPEALQGFHSENLIFLIDEASGIPDEVFQVAEGALSSENVFIVMAANPTRMSGYFYDSHHGSRASWACEHWDGEESALVSRKYVEEMAAKYGPESAIYKIRVKGDFAGNPDGIISLDLIESACNREIKPFGDIFWGLDVARFGEDANALAKRTQNTLLAPVVDWRGVDTMQTVGRVKREFDDTPASMRPRKIFVDVIGVGAGVVDRLAQMDLPVIGVNVAESASINERYERLRDELWFKGREWFESKAVGFLRDEETIGELTLPTYKLSATGKIKVEGKDELKRRGVASPNKADAFLLTFAHGGYGPGTSASRMGGLKMPPIKYPSMGIR